MIQRAHNCIWCNFHPKSSAVQLVLLLLFFMILFWCALHQYRHLAYHHHTTIPAAAGRHAGCLLLYFLGLQWLASHLIDIAEPGPWHYLPRRRFPLTAIENGIGEGLVTTDSPYRIQKACVRYGTPPHTTHQFTTLSLVATRYISITFE